MRLRYIYLLLLMFFILLVQHPLSYAAAAGKIVRVGFVPAEPLAFYGQPGYIQGLYIETLEEIASYEGWRLKYTFGTPGRIIHALQNGEVDIIGGLPEDSIENNFLAYSFESITLAWGSIYAPLDSPIRNLLDLKGQTIAIAKYDYHGKKFKELCKRFELNCQFVETEGMDEAFEAVQNQDASAAAISRLYGDRHAYDYRMRNTFIVFDAVGLNMAALTGDNEGLLTKFDLYVGRWKRDEGHTLQNIINRWCVEASSRPSDAIDGEWRERGQFLLVVIVLGLTIILMSSIVLRWRISAAGARFRDDMESISRSEKRYRLLVESVPYGLQEIDTQGVILFTNTAEHQIRRCNPGELIGKSLLELSASDEEKKQFQRYLEKLVTEQPFPEPYYHKIIRKDGHQAELRWEWSYKRDEWGNVTGFFALVTDVTEVQSTKRKILLQHVDLKKMADERAADLVDAYNDLLITATVFEHTTEGILVTDLVGRIHTVNPAYTHITGYPEQEILGRTLAYITAHRNPDQFYNKLWQTLQRQGQWQGEIFNRHKSGILYPAWLSLNAVRNAGGDIVQYVGLLSDITKRKQYERQIWKQANYDALTGLPNRHLFHRRLQHAIAEASTDKLLACLMFIDLDKFKEVNDTMGHDAGDELLKTVSQRLSHCVRKGDTVARMGGDEFTVIMPHLKEVEEATNVARKILIQLNKPFNISGSIVSISGSVGIVLYPRDGDNLTALLKNADITMYRVKERGRNGYDFYSQEEE